MSIAIALVLLGMMALVGCDSAAAISSAATSDTPTPLTQVGANIIRPFSQHIKGGICAAGITPATAGKVSFGFPDLTHPLLLFALGPNPAVADLRNNPPYTGPGNYQHIAITGMSGTEQHFAGFATIVVQIDKQGGTFALEDGSVAGAWRCGSALVTPA